MYKGLVLVFSSGLAWRVIIDLVTNGARGCLVWHVVYRAWRFNGSLRFGTRPIYVHTYFIRRPPHVRVWPVRLEAKVFITFCKTRGKKKSTRPIYIPWP